VIDVGAVVIYVACRLQGSTVIQSNFIAFAKCYVKHYTTSPYTEHDIYFLIVTQANACRHCCSFIRLLFYIEYHHIKMPVVLFMNDIGLLTMMVDV